MSVVPAKAKAGIPRLRPSASASSRLHVNATDQVICEMPDLEHFRIK